MPAEVPLRATASSARPSPLLLLWHLAWIYLELSQIEQAQQPLRARLPRADGIAGLRGPANRPRRDPGAGRRRTARPATRHHGAGHRAAAVGLCREAAARSSSAARRGGRAAVVWDLRYWIFLPLRSERTLRASPRARRVVAWPLGGSRAPSTRLGQERRSPSARRHDLARSEQARPCAGRSVLRWRVRLLRRSPPEEMAP